MPLSHDLPEHYRLWPDADKALLGRGGASEVWRAQDERLGVLVALKVMRSTGARFMARLEREAALAARIGHPNVVALHDLGRTPGGAPFVAFALASDGSMLDVAARPPPWEELKSLLIGMLQALGALHARGVLHLDVKLSNLLLHRGTPGRRELWLADLGVARAMFEEEAEEGNVVGTVVYMAPERLTGQRHLWGPSTDLFSVGAVTYRVLCGKLPFEPRDPAEALASRQRPPRRLPVMTGLDVPAGLDEIVLALLEPDPRARFDLPSDLIRALEALPEVGGPRRPPPVDPTGAAWGSVQGAPRWNRPRPTEPPETLPRCEPRRRVPHAPALLAYREVPLVGRDDTLEKLWLAARAAMRTGRPLLLDITGPRGVGRTRLVREFVWSVEQAGFGEGVTVENAVRDGPALGLLGAWRRVYPPAPDAESYAQAVAATLARDRRESFGAAMPDARRLTSWIAPQTDDAPLDRSVAISMLVEHLERRSWRGLSWLVLEDAHLAPEGDDTWALVEAVMAADAPILVIATTRSDTACAPLDAVKVRFEGLTRTVRLRPLDPEAVGELARACLPVSDRLVQRLTRSVEGNPRHVRQLLVHLARTGALIERPGEPGEEPSWDLAEDAPPFPTNRHAFARELLALALVEEPTLEEPLLAAALAGRGTPEHVLERVAGEGLSRMVLAGLMTIEHGNCVLLPPELPEAVRALPSAEALGPELHARLSDAWEKEGRDPACLARVGLHRAAAGRAAEALPSLDAALRVLRAVKPVPEVERLARTTLEAHAAAGTVGSPGWTEAALASSAALWHLDRRDEALALDDQALEKAPTDTLRVQAACMRSAHLCQLERAGDAFATLDGVAPLTRSVPKPLQAQYLAERAYAHAWRMETEASLAASAKALALGPEPQVEAPIHMLRSRLLAPTDPAASALAGRRALEVARARGLVRLEAEAWSHTALLLAAQGRENEAVRRLKVAIARVRSLGDRLTVAKLLNSLGEVHRRLGRVDEAREAYREVIALCGDDFTSAGAIASANLGLLAVETADWEELVRLLPEVEVPQDDGQLSCAWAWMRVIASLHSGPCPTSCDEQVRELLDGPQVAHAVRLGVDGIFLVSVLADCLTRCGHAKTAARLRWALRQTAVAEGVDIAAADPLVARCQANAG